MKNWLKQPLRAAATAICLVAGMGLAPGAMAGGEGAPAGAPTRNKGLTVSRLGEIPADMIANAVGLAGHHLMVRTLTVAPGGQIRVHHHVGRPGLVVVIGGELVDARESGEVIHGAGGAAIVEDENTVHWLLNRGDEPARAVLCDLRPPVRHVRLEDDAR